MLVLCLCRVRQHDFTQLHALCVSMCMPTCTRLVRDMYVCGSAGTSLSRQWALPRTVCMRQRGHFQAARHFQALHACGSVSTFSLSRTTCMRQLGRFHSFTLKAARWHLSMSAATVCRTARALQFVGVCSSLLEFAFEFVGVCVESGGPCPAQPRQS